MFLLTKIKHKITEIILNRYANCDYNAYMLNLNKGFKIVKKLLGINFQYAFINKSEAQYQSDHF